MEEQRVKYVLGARQRQIEALRERAQLDEFKIRVLTAFLYALILRHGTQRVAASDISRYLDGYQLVTARSGKDYLLAIGSLCGGDGTGAKTTGAKPTGAETTGAETTGAENTGDKPQGSAIAAEQDSRG